MTILEFAKGLDGPRFTGYDGLERGFGLTVEWFHGIYRAMRIGRGFCCEIGEDLYFSDLRNSFENFPFSEIEGLHTPELGELEKSYLADCIESGFVSSVGAYVDRFESEIAEFSGAQNVVATSSGTTALHLALLAIGVQPGDIVIVPAILLSQIANAVAHCGATVVALDVEGQSMGLNPAILSQFLERETRSHADGTRVHIETGAVVRAVMAVHVLDIRV